MSSGGGNETDGPKVLAVVLAVAAVLGTLHLGETLDGDGGEGLPLNPFLLILGFLTGNLQLPEQTLMAAGIVAVPFLGAMLALVRWSRNQAGVDAKARHMGKGKEIAALTTDPPKTAKRLGITGAPGLPIGRSIIGRQPLWQDWEACATQIWPPRKGKTSSQSIRRIVAAPGPVVATTNKGGRNEITVATRGVREQVGTVYVMDPQGIAGEKPGTMWWNPLSYIPPGPTGVTKARGLAKIFVESQRDPGDRKDAFFDSAGQTLLADMLLAAATGHKPITTVLDWLDHPDDLEPVRILEAAGAVRQASSVQEKVNAPDKQRAGMYSTASNAMTWLGSPEVQAWCTRPRGYRAVEFSPERFVRSDADTLYLLSREGEGSTAPLITAMTVAVCDAAVVYARSLEEGRLPVPMVVELDEAANICRWKDLPDLVSHLGSQGICVTTYLQSWAQGEEVWGKGGMNKLWGASNVAVIGPGLKDAATLRDMSELIGDHDRVKVSRTSAERGRSRSWATEKRRTMTTADLNGLVAGRIIVWGPSGPPTLAKPVPWWKTKAKAAIKASQRQYAPAREPDHTPTDVPSPRDLRDNPWAGART